MPVSKKNELKDFASLLTTLHRSHTSDLKNGLLSELTRPTSPSSSSSSHLLPTHLSSNFSSFPLHPSSSPLPPLPSSLPTEIVTFANEHIRSLLPPPRSRKRRRPDSEEEDAREDKLRRLDEAHEAPLILSTLQVLSSTLGMLAQQTPLEGTYRAKKNKKGRREREKGWESVLRVLGGVGGGLEDW